MSHITHAHTATQQHSTAKQIHRALPASSAALTPIKSSASDALCVRSTVIVVDGTLLLHCRGHAKHAPGNVSGTAGGQLFQFSVTAIEARISGLPGVEL
jgi:hypothetical protein